MQEKTDDIIDDGISLSIAAITGPDIQNGPGVRLTVWVSGCGHNCPGCHNKWLQKYDNAPKRTIREAIGIIARELNKKTDDGYIYDGITFSGGDPLMQSKNALNEMKTLIRWIRNLVRPDINIWLYTGFDFPYLWKNSYYHNYIKEIMPDVIIDGQYIEKYKAGPGKKCVWRGSTNQRLIDVKKTYETGIITEFTT